MQNLLRSPEVSLLILYFHSGKFFNDEAQIANTYGPFPFCAPDDLRSYSGQRTGSRTGSARASGCQGFHRKLDTHTAGQWLTLPFSSASWRGTQVADWFLARTYVFLRPRYVPHLLDGIGGNRTRHQTGNLLSRTPGREGASPAVSLKAGCAHWSRHLS